MFNPRRPLPAFLWIVICAALALAPSASAHRGGHLRHARLEHLRCGSSARRARSAHRRCTTRSRRLARRREHHRSKPAASPGEGAGAAPAAQSSSAPNAAATIANVLATPCQNTELTPEANNIALVREAVLCLINRKRAENGESPLVASAQLEEAAEEHCQELIADDYFAHVSPSGETPVERIRATGYIPSPADGYVIGENLAWGTYQLSTAQSIASAWFASPEHLANILEAHYLETGIAVTPAVPASVGEGAPGATYAQEFGVVIP